MKDETETDPNLAMLLYLFTKNPPTPLEFLKASPSERWILQGLLAAYREEVQNVD